MTIEVESNQGGFAGNGNGRGPYVIDEETNFRIQLWNCLVVECGPVNAVSAVSKGNNPRISSSPSLAFSERPDYLAVFQTKAFSPYHKLARDCWDYKNGCIPIGQKEEAVRGPHSIAQLNVK